MKAIRLISVFFVAFLASINSAKAEKADVDLIKVYIDESRSLQLGRQVWKQFRRKNGYVCVRSMDLIDYEKLKLFDVIIIWNQIESLPYTEDELASVERFVAEGGGLILLGNPGPYAKTKAKFQKGKGRIRTGFINVAPVDPSGFCAAQMAGLFGVVFTNATKSGKPIFNNQHIANKVAVLSRCSFDQPLAGLICLNKSGKHLMSQYHMPVAVSVSHGKGRAIICAAHNLFQAYGSLADRQAGKHTEIVNSQKALLDNWLKWLSFRKNSQKYSSSELPSDIYPRVKIPGQMADFYCIPQLRDQTQKLVADWDKMWTNFSDYIGVSSPVEMVRFAKPGDHLTVFVRAAKAGGLSGGLRVSIPIISDDWRAAGILGHEVGHKLLRGVRQNHSTSEGFAEWMNCRGLKAAGYIAEAEKKLNGNFENFRKIDPAGTKLDIADRTVDTKYGAACQGKWMWILYSLEKKFGDDFIRRYVQSLRNDPGFSGSFEDVVGRMSQAAGEDLTPWFQQLGITVK
jgi:hypothetical protein